MRRAGLDFNAIARETLTEILGETPSEVLFMAFGNLTESPKTFARKLSLMFPERTVTIILDLVAKSARASLANPASAGSDSQFERLIREMELLPGIRSEGPKLALLHDHREEDELDRLVGHRTT